jgi:Beta-lactamase
LIIKDGRIHVERYQYDRNAMHRFVSHTMAKSIVSLAVGFALQEKQIGSLDDQIAKYVPRLSGSAYGETSIRNLLRMSSGVRFTEVYDGKDDLAKFTALRNSQGSIEALGGRSFNAVLRDYTHPTGGSECCSPMTGRLAQQIVPREYLLEATDWHRHPPAFAPQRATPYFGYGYQFWTYPGEKRSMHCLASTANRCSSIRS